MLTAQGDVLPSSLCQENQDLEPKAAVTGGREPSLLEEKGKRRLIIKSVR